MHYITKHGYKQDCSFLYFIIFHRTSMGVTCLKNMMTLEISAALPRLNRFKNKHSLKYCQSFCATDRQSKSEVQ
jgi:hypothetical protein